MYKHVLKILPQYRLKAVHVTISRIPSDNIRMLQKKIRMKRCGIPYTKSQIAQDSCIY